MKSLFLLLTAGIATTQPMSGDGLKIVTRATYSDFVNETILYLQGDRKREEIRISGVSLGSAGGDTSTTLLDSPHITITRCDVKQRIWLDQQLRSYVLQSIQPTVLERMLSSIVFRRMYADGPPTRLIETSTVDTGERKNAYGRTARHVITTTKEIPLAPEQAHGSETVTDGWYVDLDADISCMPHRWRGARLQSVLVGVGTGNRASPRLPVVSLKNVGTPEEGYPIELTTRTREHANEPNGNARAWRVQSRQIVTELESMPLDPQLFRIPKGYRPARGYFASVADRVSGTWDLFRRAAASYF